MDEKTLLERLKRDGDGSPLARLSTLTLDLLLDSKVAKLLPPERAAETVRQGIEGWLRSPQAVPALERLVEQASQDLSKDSRRLKDLVPSELKAVLLELAGRPYSPDRRLVLTLLDRPQMRELIRGLLYNTVLDFARRASAPVAGVAKGLGGLMKIAAETAKSRTGSLGALVGAAGEVVEKQLEKRTSDFVDSALGGVFGELADAVSDPKRAAEAAELRTEALEGALDLTLPQLSRELINLDVPGGAKTLRDGLERWVSGDEAMKTIRAACDRIAEREGGRTLREVLEEAGQLQVARTLGRQALEERMREVVSSDAFADWLRDTLS
ncbi:MAG: hypothetical protein QM723_28695 [Myxococcaceae bacterium]